ncbi:nucleotide exchange factor GrpE, partial [Aliarcobacter butzleri]|uniref:nucleotide exchange factor GrpE n=1 Tax=Aliarcobacter butzleri TaxID=28197 RepID=UPI003B21809A
MQDTVETKEKTKTEEAEQKPESLEEKVARLEGELKESEENFLRAYADFENMKKRLE